MVENLVEKIWTSKIYFLPSNLESTVLREILNVSKKFAYTLLLFQVSLWYTKIKRNELQIKGGCHMGIYLNPGNEDFQRALNSEIYVDKSMLIAYTNKRLNTEQGYICVSRPRRFGKSMAANMLTAYYSRGCDSKNMFSGLTIADDVSFEKYLNKYHVIHLDITKFILGKHDIDEMIAFLSKKVLRELKKEFANVDCSDWEDLISTFGEIYDERKDQFVFIIDEWDCVFREWKNEEASQEKYLDFLRDLLKGQSYVALAYMTGILPIKKYGIHSAINVFHEYSMTGAKPIEEFTGFTEEEVTALCGRYEMPMDEIKRWYDGYNVDGISIYNPQSVVEALLRKSFNNYWTQTETYHALSDYIRLNYDGLRDKITQMIAGGRVTINTRKFQNDMTTFHSADDVLTLLVHLGYLTFDFDTKEAYIPNNEVQQEFINSIEDGGWESIMDTIHQSENLLDATLACNEETVAKLIEQAHQDNTSILKYNDENSLACVISIAYYAARKNYVIHREMPAGKGFADLIFEPRRNCSLPAFIVELKRSQSDKTAVEQIQKKDYTDALKNYIGEVLLVGINYDEENHHTCKIKRTNI